MNVAQDARDAPRAVSAHDVARELRRRVPAGALALQKLLYYCQGWHVAWTGRPMFRETIEAWENGPVVADLWRDEARGRTPPPAQDLDPEMEAALEYVVSQYGRRTGKSLMEATHEEPPWMEATSGGQVLNMPITHDALTSYFGTNPGLNLSDAQDSASMLRPMDMTPARVRLIELLSRVAMAEAAGRRARSVGHPGSER